MVPKSRKRQLTAPLILSVLLLMNAPAATAGRGPLPKQAAGVAHDDHEAFFTKAWLWMMSLLENGLCIDPDGRCALGATPSGVDRGACIDPNGGCVAPSS